MTWKKTTGQLAALALIIAVIAIAFAPKATLVDVHLIERGPMQETIEEEGKTRVTDRFTISAPVDGFVRRIELDIGDRVEVSQIVAQLEPLRSRILDPRSQAEAKARVEAAKSAHLAAQENAKAAKADAVFAGDELKRLEKLYQRNSISTGTFQQAQARARRTAAQLKSAEFGVQVAQFEREAAQTTLRYYAADNREIQTEKVAIVASVAGRVLKVYHESEGVVPAGEPLLELGDPASLEIAVDVLSQDAVRIAAGTPVNIDRWGGDTRLHGRVRMVEPVGFTKTSALGVEEQRVLVIVDIVSPPAQWQRLGDGYRVETRFVLWESNDVLQIPTSALFRYQGEWAAFVLEDHRAKLRRITLDHRNGLSAELIDGLSENERVITHPDDAVYDGKRVRLRE
jgi:HlyD family secretion protein